MKVLSVVCARACSKGLANKCIAKINNKMIVEYAIEYSLSLGSNVETVISTDIAEVIRYCKRENIACIERDLKFCADESKIDDAIADAIVKKGQGCECCSLIYGNIPTRYPNLFHDALNVLQKNKDYDAVISMQNVEKFHPEWMFDYDEEVLPLEAESHYRRQSLPQKMIHDGHTLVFRKDDFYNRYNGRLPYNKEYRYSIFGSNIKPLINNEIIVDIDTKKDLILAEALILNGK
jgi:CMP-N-acetylneuraminic acid synthetase|tara:strand:- start:2823 stop:3527 length:705 start_codon:yes stop_codon:yes gene_type:complete